MSLDTAKALAVLRSMTVRFDESLNAYQPFWPTIAFENPSDGKDEEYGWLGAVPEMVEWLGEARFEEMRASSFVVANRDWVSGVKVDKKDIDDDRVGMYGPLAANLGEQAARHPDKLVLDSIVNGHTLPTYDGQYFFDTDHSFGDSGAQSNLLTYDAANHLTVTALEMKDAVSKAVDAILGFKNDRGTPFHQGVITRMSGIKILVPAALRKVAYEAFESIIINNNSNVIIDRPDIYPVPSLASGVAFYTFWTEGTIKPVVFQKRKPLTRWTKGLDDPELKHLKFGADARYAVYPVAWWKSVKTTFN